jgi:hypothetical protein
MHAPSDRRTGVRRFLRVIQVPLEHPDLLFLPFVLPS